MGRNTAFTHHHARVCAAARPIHMVVGYPTDLCVTSPFHFIPHAIMFGSVVAMDTGSLTISFYISAHSV